MQPIYHQELDTPINTPTEQTATPNYKLPCCPSSLSRPQDRASFKQDPRFNEIMSDIEKGMFGDKEYFKPLVDSVSNMQV